MNPTVLMLVLVSVVLHAGWNLLGKRESTSLAFFALAMGLGGVLLTPLLLIGPAPWALPGPFWYWLLASCLCQALYLGGLAWAYARGEISVLYPLARALPVMLVPLITVGMLGRQTITVTDWLGMGSILLGALCLPLPSLKALRPRSYASPALGYVLLAALGTTGYSLLDKQALDVMTAQGYPAFIAGTHYMVLQALTTLLCALPIIVGLPDERRRLPQLYRHQRKALALTGTMMVVTYGLVLMALSMTPQVSHVVALRQLSLPLGALLGIVWLKEGVTAMKLLGLAILLGGLILVTL